MGWEDGNISVKLERRELESESIVEVVMVVRSRESSSADKLGKDWIEQ